MLRRNFNVALNIYLGRKKANNKNETNKWVCAHLSAMIISSECFNLLGRNTWKTKILILPLEQIIPRYCSTLWLSFSGYLFLEHQRMLRQ